MYRTNNQLIMQKLLFIQDVEKIIGRNRLTLRRWWTAGKFPTPTKLNGTALAWHTEVIDLWIKQNLMPGEVVTETCSI